MSNTASARSSAVSAGRARSSAGTIGIVGTVLVLLILLLADYAGGYVAGRMAVVIGTLLAAVSGGKAGSHYHRKVDRVGL